MKKALSDYLSGALDREWSWGRLDCLLFCADWVRATTGVDPAGEFRGTYRDERAGRRLIKAQGGIEMLAAKCMEGRGFARTVRPLVGDIGLVRVPILLWRGRTVAAPVGAICLGPRMWAIKTKVRGEMVARDFPLIAAWRIEPLPTHA